MEVWDCYSLHIRYSVSVVQRTNVKLVCGSFFISIGPKPFIYHLPMVKGFGPIFKEIFILTTQGIFELSFNELVQWEQDSHQEFSPILWLSPHGERYGYPFNQILQELIST